MCIAVIFRGSLTWNSLPLTLKCANLNKLVFISFNCKLWLIFTLLLYYRTIVIQSVFFRVKGYHRDISTFLGVKHVNFPATFHCYISIVKESYTEVKPLFFYENFHAIFKLHGFYFWWFYNISTLLFLSF